MQGRVGIILIRNRASSQTSTMFKSPKFPLQSPQTPAWPQSFSRRGSAHGNIQHGLQEVVWIIMSYYFSIVGNKDNPLFELEFGTSKQGGDGIARFSAKARQLNPFIVHASLDIVEEVQWLNSQM